MKDDKQSMIMLPLNKSVCLIPNVSLNVITAVISKIIRAVFWINFELSFLKTPKINKNIIDNERNISGKTNSKFDILTIHYAHIIKIY